MNFDERLERLAERHEALTQSVELIARMHMKTEEAQLKNEQAQLKNEILMGHVIESIDSLARIAHAHETRITNIEDRRQ